MQRILRTSLWLLLFAAAGGAAPIKARVSLELCTKTGLPITSSQQWYKVLTDLGVSGLQIRSANPGDEMAIVERGSKDKPDFKVIGILASDNTLYLPGGKFSLNDTGRLRKWFDDLGDQGSAGVTEKRSAFGLLGRQLELVNTDLKKPVGFSTVNMPAASAVSKIAARLDFPLLIDDELKRELAAVTLADELKGVSSGTALAMALRPAGLIFEPQRPANGDLQYRVGKPQADHQAWPVGWKPEGKANKVLPDLLEFLNVEIKEIPVSEALEAIQGRLKVALYFDHNALVLHEIDPAKIEANVPSKRMTYSQILNKILLQAKLKYEVRLDENDSPFLWITSVKPTP